MRLYTGVSEGDETTQGSQREMRLYTGVSEGDETIHRGLRGR